MTCNFKTITLIQQNVVICQILLCCSCSSNTIDIYSWIIEPSALALIARFMWSKWGPPGADRAQLGPILTTWTLLSGVISRNVIEKQRWSVKLCDSWCRHQMEYFPRYWPFVRGIQWSPVNSPHKGKWRGALMFPLICAWINGWVNNEEAGDLGRHPAHYDVIVMRSKTCISYPYSTNHVIVIYCLCSN